MGYPAQDLRVIGVTGTNGKSTTVALLTAILEAAGVRAGCLGSLGVSDGVEQRAASRGHAGPPMLARWMARTAATGCSHAVLELSSHALGQHHLAGGSLDMACITNVTCANLQNHNSLASYRQILQRILDYIDDDGVAILNADDPATMDILATVRGPAVTYGIHHAAEVTATLLDQQIHEQAFLLTIDNESAIVRTRMIGEHHVSNCLAAAATASAYGIDLMTIAQGLESIEQLAGRMERIDCGQPFAAIVDHAHTPDALAACLTATKNVTPGRLICVFGAMGRGDRRERSPLGATLSRLADVAVITTDSPFDEDPARIASDLATPFDDDRRPEVLLDRGAAIAWAIDHAEPGDAVVVAGRGQDTEQTIGRRTVHFDDRQFVRDLLYQNHSSSTVSRTSA